MADQVRLVEVGPRDGLQNLPNLVPTDDKITLVDLLSNSGLRHIEVTSFVSPKWVPQLADATEVMAGITRKPGVTYAALTPNLVGYNAAKAAGAMQVALFAAASEGFSWRNINCSIATSLERFAPLMAAAAQDKISVRGYVSCVIACPYDGVVAPAAVAAVVERLAALGCSEISLGDTIGVGTPQSISAMLQAVFDIAPADQLAGHYHDTNGQALQNIEASLALGLRSFDAAVAGLGGCPYAPGAKGNVDTGAVVRRLHELGLRTGIIESGLEQAAKFARSLVNS